MKKALVVLLLLIFSQVWGLAQGQEAPDPVAEKYSASLNRIFDLAARFAPLHPALGKVYPVAIVENKMFHIFEPVPGEKIYRLVRTAPDTFDIPTGIRAAMPLAFWDNRMACVVTGEVFGQPDGYVFIFHEFVHCAQWDCCEQKLKEGLSIYREAMQTKNYMWELQYPFPYSSPDFVKTYSALIQAWAANDAAADGSLRASLKKILSSAEWEYLTWQEWKEGLARYLENRMREVAGLSENKGGANPPFNRVTFYRGGDELIRFLEWRQPGISDDLTGLYRAISAAPEAVVVRAGGAAVAETGSRDEDKPSYFTELWQLDKKTRAGQPGVTFHRSNYALAFSYNSSPNPAPLQEVDPAKTLTKPEVTFEISFKARLWRDVLGKDLNLWGCYTQRSFWQLYNIEDSSPFRETDYEPELLLTLSSRFSLLGLNARFFQLGVNHQSNGQSEPLSRSWNRIVANVGIERGRLSVLLKGWYRIPDAEDDNPGLVHYVGNGEIWAYYFLKKHRLGIMLRDNLNFRENRGALQLEWSFPVFAMIGGYVQYFLGYGESLLDFNHRVNRIGIGFILSDWY